MAPLAELAEKIDYGVTASASAADIGPKFLRITDIQDGEVDWNSVPFCDAKNGNLTRSRLKVGDIVFARTGATTGKSYLIRSCPQDAVFASYLIRVRAGSDVDSGYLARFFESSGYWRQLASKTVGAAQPGVNASKLGELSIPLPPLPEQKRIAAILDQADSIRRKRQSVARELERLREASLDRACRLATSALPLSSLFIDIKMGPFGSLLHKTDYVSDGVPLINPMHIERGRIRPDPKFSVAPAKAKELRAYRIEPEDIVIGRRGEMGRAALVLPEHAGLLCGTGSMRLRVNRDFSAPEFMADFLSHPRTVREIGNAASGATMLNLSSKSFDKIIVRFPSLDAQVEYRKIKAEIAKKRDSLERGVAVAEAFFASLQHRAFRGEL